MFNCSKNIRRLGSTRHPRARHDPGAALEARRSAGVHRKQHRRPDASGAAVGGKATSELVEPQPGNAPAMFAAVSALVPRVGYRPVTPVRDGTARFASCYREHYRQ